MKFRLNIFESVKQCRSYGLSIWQCPQFLFPVMGAIVIAAIIATYFSAQSYVAEPEIVALIVLVVAAVLFVIGHIVISSFEIVAGASRAKSEFVSIMSHQLRTPLSIIKWQLNLLSEKKVKIEDPEAKDFFIHLYEENQRMIHIINDLLELNRIQDNTLYFDLTTFSLKEVVVNLANRRNRPHAESEPNVFVEVKAPDDLPNVFADKTRTEAVVSHIVDNAIRYSVNSGKVTILLEVLPKYIRCSVTDQGIGISKEDTKRIFSKFFRAENVFRYQTQGLGIRLYLAKVIVEASGGKIGFISQEGKGSTFWFTLPKYGKI